MAGSIVCLLALETGFFSYFRLTRSPDTLRDLLTVDLDAEGGDLIGILDLAEGLTTFDEVTFFVVFVSLTYDLRIGEVKFKQNVFFSGDVLGAL